MENGNETKTKALFIIVNAGFSAEVIEIARKAGAKGATILSARGEGAEQQSFMGITVDTEKEIILTLVEEHLVGDIMAAVKANAGWDSPIESITFSMPVERTTPINNFIPQEKHK